MSRENVEIVQAGIAAWNAADMQAFRDLYHPDVIMHPMDDWPEPGPFVGRDAVMDQWKQIRETYDDADTLEPVSDVIEVGDRIVARLVWHGVGHGPDLDMEMTCVYTMRKGRIFIQEFFWDHSEALEAVGLRE